MRRRPLPDINDPVFSDPRRTGAGKAGHDNRRALVDA